MMENLALVSSPKIVLGCSPNPQDVVFPRYSFGLPHLSRMTRRSRLIKPNTTISALSTPQGNHGRAPIRLPKTNEKLQRESFASITSSSSQETSSVGVNPQLAVPPPPSNFGSPLFWVGVGVGLSALFSWVASYLKGISIAISEYFPGANHRRCCRHLYNNFKAQHGGIQLRSLFWGAARASFQAEFTRYMTEMKDLSSDAQKWLMELPLHTWARHKFDERVKNDHVTNNITESFNNWVGDLRQKPIVTLVDFIRRKLMKMLRNRYEKGIAWSTFVTPNTVKKLEKLKEKARHCDILFAGGDEFEVNEGITRFVVMIDRRTCSYGVWEISGIPCKHGIAALLYKRLNVQYYCSPYFTKHNYLEAYGDMIHPLLDESMWPEAMGDPIGPPLLRRLPGRPKKNRRKEPGETSGSSAKRKLHTISCSNCNEMGHNKRACQRAPVARATSRGRGRGRKSSQKYAMQQAFKTLMGQMDSQNSQFNNAAFSPASPFPFPTPSVSGSVASPSFPTSPEFMPATSPSPVTVQSALTVDVAATKVENPPATDVKDITETEEPKKYAFVDVSPEETLQKSPFGGFEETSQSDSSKDDGPADQVSQNGAAPKLGVGGSSEWSSSTRKTSTGLSVEALEKMMEDPTVQKMVYPYLPEEMRNPTTFKWMLQNPQYRQQLEDMLNNMGGSTEWDNRMMDSLKNFDLSSPEVKQQFDQIGLTPEEVISKIMANPDVAMAFQNPRVQAAIMDCSQNPLSIAKYQNDKEVMDVFNKISELFPGATSSF